MSVASTDIWSQWILQRRFGGDPQRMHTALDSLIPVRDTVLTHMQLPENGLLLDVGCGDGLIAFGALERFPTCQVIFSDISQDLLDHVQAAAQRMGVLPRCQFIRASADDLSAISTASVDAVTTRSVLIYVTTKQRAFGEFYRVLKPHGHLSIFEPINRFGAPAPAHMFWGYDMTPIRELAQKIKLLYQRLQPPDTDPMLDFDEWDLFSFAEQTGFASVYLDVHAEMRPVSDRLGWDQFVSIAPNPKVPSLKEAIQEVFTPIEAARFEAHLRPLVETYQGRHRSAGVFLWATKA
jgi:arsenite methyltransferase